MNVLRTVQFLRRWLPVMLLGLLVGGLAAVLLVRQLPSAYEATVTFMVHAGDSPSAGPGDQQGAQDLAQTYVEAIHTRLVLQQAATATGLAGLSDAELSDRVKVRRVTGTSLVRISADDSDPAMAADLANHVGQVFISITGDNQTARFRMSEDNLARLVGQLSSDLSARYQQLDDLNLQPASPQRDAQIAQVQASLTQLQASHDGAARSYEDLKVTEARAADTLTIVEPASPPQAPARPNRLLATGLAMLAGFVVATGIAFGVEYFDDRLRDRQRLAALTGLPALGVVPRGEANPDRRKSPAGTFGESYWLLRSNLLAAGTQPPRVLLVTSAGIGDGKSTTAANLAHVLAESGQQVVLIDANLREPSQADLFRIPNTVGLTSLLVAAEGSVLTTLQPTSMPTLRVLAAGPVAWNPLALLSSRRVQQVLTETCELCDIVVVDTPALLAHPDAALLGRLADAVLLVVDARRSRSRDVTRTLGLLSEAGARVIGALLNNVPVRSAEFSAAGTVYPPPASASAPEPGRQ